jgi:putative transposase
VVVEFVGSVLDRFGVEPSCRVLIAYGRQIALCSYYAVKSRPPSARAVRDAARLVDIDRVFHDRSELAGVRKVWRLLKT